MNIFVKSQHSNENKNNEFEMKLDIYYYENKVATRYLMLKEIKEKIIKSIIDSKHNENYNEIKKHLEDIILYYSDDDDKIFLDKDIDLEALIQYYITLNDPSSFVLIAEVNFENFPNQAKNNVVSSTSNNNNTNNNDSYKNINLDDINIQKNQLREILQKEKDIRNKKKIEKELENDSKLSNKIIVNQNDSINFEDKNMFVSTNNLDLNAQVREIILREIDLETLANKLSMEITNNMSVYINNNNNTDQTKLIHKGFKCNICKNGKDIEGIRYSCIICKVPYNLCEKCESELEVPHDHPLAKFKYRLDQKKVNDLVSKQFQFMKFEESMIKVENKEEKPFELANFGSNTIEESVILMEDLMK